MPIEHRVDSSTGILFVRRWGLIDTQDETEALLKRQEDPLVVAYIPVLVDCREVNPPDSVEVIQYLAYNVTSHAKALDCGPVAIIVSSDAEYGMARMYISMTNLVHPDMNVFRDYDEGLKWLLARRSRRSDGGT